VFDAAVVGVPDERWGERVVAVVAARPGRLVDPDDLDAHCREHLASFKVPRRVVTVAEVRRLPSGKVDHPWVRSTARTSLTGRQVVS
jgi:fatty-acyl-CoA synthase